MRGYSGGIGVANKLETSARRADATMGLNGSRQISALTAGKFPGPPEIRLRVPRRVTCLQGRCVMPGWPKSIHRLSTRFETALTARRLRATTSAAAAQARTHAHLLGQLAATKFWREAGIDGPMAYDTFRQRVAPRLPDQLAPAIERMRQGEADVLWPGRCDDFALTAGTTQGRSHVVPMTRAMLDHMQAATREALFYYCARTGGTAVFDGRFLLAGGCTALAAIPRAGAPAAQTGYLGGILGPHLPESVAHQLAETDAETGALADWDRKLAAIGARCIAQDITLLAGSPPWVLALAAALRKAAPSSCAHLQEIWPRLECYVHGGVPIAPYQDALRTALGPSVNFHEVYLAAEGCLAAQDAAATGGLRVIADRGIFFEFIALNDYDKARLGPSGTKAVPLAGVKTGVNYVVLLTTPAGFVRHVLGDVVRFTSTEPHRLVQVGRTDLQLTAFDERVSEKDITDALRGICQRQGWTIVNFHVAPLFAANHTGGNRGRHEWWVELIPGTHATPTGPALAAELDGELLRTNPDYAARRRAGVLDAPFVRLVMPGVFEHWLRFRQRWGAPHKMPRCRSDRLVADELAQMTNFARD